MRRAHPAGATRSPAPRRASSFTLKGCDFSAAKSQKPNPKSQKLNSQIPARFSLFGIRDLEFGICHPLTAVALNGAEYQTQLASFLNEQSTLSFKLRAIMPPVSDSICGSWFGICDLRFGIWVL
jgi:hypothetical protein